MHEFLLFEYCDVLCDSKLEPCTPETEVGKATEPPTGPKFEQPTFNCNICFSVTHKTSRSCLSHAQEPCEWVDADFGVL